MSEPSPGPEIVAYRIGADPGMPLVPASATREWRNATREHLVNHCLSLRVANQAGWFVLNDKPFVVCWDGGTGRSSLRIRAVGDDPDLRATSFSGYGILTFYIPYLFRTSAGFNLLARGPANLPKDGISALEGLVETDWAVATFSMNWKLTQPGLDIMFEMGEPVCMIVPQRRGELEGFAASTRGLDTEPALADQHQVRGAGRNRRLHLSHFHQIDGDEARV